MAHALAPGRQRRKQSRRSTITIKEIVEDRRKRKADAARAEAQQAAAAEAEADAQDAADIRASPQNQRASQGPAAASPLPEDFLRMAPATPAAGMGAAREPAATQQCLFPEEVPHFGCLAEHIWHGHCEMVCRLVLLPGMC